MIKTMNKRQVKFRQRLLGVNKKSLWCTSLVPFLKYNSGLKLKNIYWSKCMISRVSSTNKEKQAKRKNRAKKQRLNRKKKEKNDSKKQKMLCCRESTPVHLQLQATPWPLHHTATHTCFEELIWFYENHFSLHRRFLKLVELYLSLIPICIWGKLA